MCLSTRGVVRGLFIGLEKAKVGPIIKRGVCNPQLILIRSPERCTPYCGCRHVGLSWLTIVAMKVVGVVLLRPTPMKVNLLC